jgi:hypothetical protein
MPSERDEPVAGTDRIPEVQGFGFHEAKPTIARSLSRGLAIV